MTIVIVEDEIRIREGLSKLIRKISPEYIVVGEAEDGVAGIKIITEKHPDLVITDVRMQGIDGLEMLYQLKENGVQVKAIVLSAHSEFSYARQAIKLGVSEYLLKPIAVGDLSHSLKTVENQLDAEQKKLHADQLRSLESILYSVIHGSIAFDDSMREFISTEYQIDPCGDFALVALYLGMSYEAMSDKSAAAMHGIVSDGSGFEYRILKFPKNQELLLFVFNAENMERTAHWFEVNFVTGIRKSGIKECCAGWTAFRNLAVIKAELQRMESCLDWSIVLGDTRLISPSAIEHLHCAPLPYPIDIEAQTRSALCAYDRDKLLAVIVEFLAYFHSERIYSPKEVKESFIRFFWAVLNAAREVDYDRYSSLPQQEVLERITFAVSWSELVQATEMLSTLVSEPSGDVKSDSVIVSRAKNLVQEFYGQGITLDEIASKINVTPEYLSTQFHSVTGVNFSTYIKNYRIKKAKELVIGTDMMLHVIGEKVGYRDSKYFCRVFKEVTGKIPSDYRKANR